LSYGSGRGWLGVVVARKADLNWKLQISNSSLTIAGLWAYGLMVIGDMWPRFALV